VPNHRQSGDFDPMQKALDVTRFSTSYGAAMPDSAKINSCDY
jgi:hypothetical protein